MSKQSDLISVSQGAAGDPLFVDAANNRVGIGTTTAASSSDVKQVISSSNGAFTQYSYNGGAGGVVGSADVGYLDFFTYTGNIGSETYTRRMTIDASGNVGIGMTTPNDALNLYKASRPYFVIQNATTGTSVADGFWVGYDSSNLDVQIRNKENAGLLFFSNDLERARVDASGNLLVGTTTVTSTGVGGATFAGASLGRMILQLGSTSATAGTELVHFYNNNGRQGSIQTNASGTVYATSSDYRLKEDVQPMVGSVDRLMALKPVNFAWKVDGSRVDGFLAHEAQAVVPEAVSGTKDEAKTVDVKDEDGNVIGTEERPVYQGIDQSKLVPLLTAALQEALQKIDALETRISALETN
jgi:hypothetical protein